MKKNLVSLLLVGALVAPSALVFAEESEDLGTIEETTQEELDIVKVIPPTSWDDDRIEIDKIVSEKVIAYGTSDKLTETLAEGVREISVAGVNGIETTIIETAYWNGGEIAWGVEDGPIRTRSGVTTQLIDEVVLVGTGIMGEERATWIIEQPFIVEIVEDSDMYIGEEEVVQEGIDGFVKYATVYETKDGRRTGNTIGEDKVIVDSELPQNKIIKRGTKEVEGQYVLTVTLTNGFDEPYPNRVISVTGHNFASRGTTDENGITTFSAPNGTYIVSAEGHEQEITIDNEDSSVQIKVELDDIGAYSREDLLGRGDDLITFETEEDAQAAIDTLDEEEQEGLEVAETDDGQFYVAHVISATPIEPIEPIKNDNFHVNVVKNDFPQYDKEGYSYEVEELDDFVIITITDKDGKFVAEIEYNIADQTTRIVSIALIPLEPAKPIEKDEETTEEETTEETTDEESEVVDVVIADGQPVRVVRTDSRSSLPETGELGGTTAMMAAALSALGGLGLLFKKRK